MPLFDVHLRLKEFSQTLFQSFISLYCVWMRPSTIRNISTTNDASLAHVSNIGKTFCPTYRALAYNTNNNNKSTDKTKLWPNSFPQPECI